MIKSGMFVMVSWYPKGIENVEDSSSHWGIVRRLIKENTEKPMLTKWQVSIDEQDKKSWMEIPEDSMVPLMELESLDMKLTPNEVFVKYSAKIIQQQIWINFRQYQQTQKIIKSLKEHKIYVF